MKEEKKHKNKQMAVATHSKNPWKRVTTTATGKYSCLGDGGCNWMLFCFFGTLG